MNNGRFCRRLGILWVASLLSTVLAQETEVSSVKLLGTTAEYRTIEHALGTTEVPLEPERIVSLTHQLTDDLLALGVKPVASLTYEGDFAYLGERASGVAPLADQADPDLEAILLEKPDLILTVSYNGNLEKTLYNQLSGIAPTVVIDETDSFSESLWLRDLGVVLGLEEEAAERWAKYETKKAEAHDMLEDAIGEEPVGLFRIRSDDFRIYGNLGYTSVLYNRGVGLTPPEVVRELAWNQYNVSVSLEALPQLADAQHLFVSVDGDEDAEAVFAGLERNPIWQALPAVQSGNVYPVDRRIWMTNGLIASELKIDDLLSALVGAE